MKREMIIVSYDPAWKEQFEELRCRLHELLDGAEVSILHFGSTAVEGMWAKPTIDIMIAGAKSVLESDSPENDSFRC